MAKLVLAIAVGMGLGAAAMAGWIEAKDGKTVIHLKLHSLPDPTRTDTASRANYAVLKEFYKQFPVIFRERYAAKYKADPAKYGTYDWDNVEIELHRFSGITVEGKGMDSGPLMAIAGGVSPDIIYVNFRQSDTYIQQNFLYPLDKPEDNYFTGLTPEEIAFQFHPKTLPVIKRKGPDGETRIWAKPSGGLLGKVMLYRKDLLDAAGLPYPGNDWTWDDLLYYCKKLTDPGKGTYGMALGRGTQESWYWVAFLWSAGGEAMMYDEAKDQWRATFDSREAALAVDFYTKLCTETWIDAGGTRRNGYASKESDVYRKWDLGQIGFMSQYIDEKLFMTINPDLVGMVPVPTGPGGHRGAELNSRMQGIFSGLADQPIIRDAAWEYLRFTESKEAMAINTRIMVEGGLGRFVNPRYLRLYGYEDVIRLAPKGWEEIFNIAIETGKPEPYGRNCQLVYEKMTPPLQEAEDWETKDQMPKATQDEVKAVLAALGPGAAQSTDEAIAQAHALLTTSLTDCNTERLGRALEKLRAAAQATPPVAEAAAAAKLLDDALARVTEARLAKITDSLQRSNTRANEEMIGILTAKQLFSRRLVAAIVLLLVGVSFLTVVRRIVKTFTPPRSAEDVNKETWGFRRFAWAYLLILPAVLTILVWHYVPLMRGTAMAFQDYQIVGDARWIGIDNFANLLWDKNWWLSCLASLRYCILVISLTFLPPVILAVLLDEIPQGKILFRTIFYLPAVITGLVVIYLWRSFYEPNEFGVLNSIVMRIPVLGWIGFGLLLFFILYFFFLRLMLHQSRWQALICLGVGILLCWFFWTFGWQIFKLTPALGMEETSPIAKIPTMAMNFSLPVIGNFGWEITWRHWTWWIVLGALMAGVVLVLVASHFFQQQRYPAFLVTLGVLIVGAVVFCWGAPAILHLPWHKLLLLCQKQPYAWLNDPDTAMVCCVLPMVWAGMGPGCLIYLAALKGIAPDFYEAADIDGATFVDKILFIVIPILKPLLVIQFVGVFIHSWQSSGYILAMTGGAKGTEVAELHIFYKAYLHLKFGPAAAMAWVLGTAMIWFTVYQLRILSRLEFRTTGNKA